LKVEDPLVVAAPLAEGAFSALLRFPASGAVLITVDQSNEGPGGLFDLTIERSVSLVPCTVHVADGDGGPIAESDVVLLREPAVESIARGKTAADGTVTLDVPPGGYTVVYRAPQRAPEVTRTVVDGREGVNLVVDR
jgi:hypothetical protein